MLTLEPIKKKSLINVICQLTDYPALTPWSVTFLDSGDHLLPDGFLLDRTVDKTTDKKEKMNLAALNTLYNDIPW